MEGAPGLTTPRALAGQRPNVAKPTPAMQGRNLKPENTP